MNINNYIEERIDGTIEYFNKSANYYNYLYHALTLIKLVLPSLLWIIGTMKVDVAIICASFLIAPELVKTIDNIIFKCRIYERWIIYSQSKEALISEKYLAITKSGDYGFLNDNEAFIHMVEKIESILSETNRNLYIAHSQKSYAKDIIAK